MFDNILIYVQYDQEREKLASLLANKFHGTVEGFAQHVVRTPNISMTIDKNSDYDDSEMKTFPDGFLYFKYLIGVDALDITYADYKLFIGQVLEFLWQNEISAIVACEFENELPKQGGYKNTGIPWPEKSLTVS